MDPLEIVEPNPKKRTRADSAPFLVARTPLRAAIMFQRPTHKNKKTKNLFIQSSLRIVIVISQLNTRQDLSNPKHHIMNTKNVFSMQTIILYVLVCTDAMQSIFRQKWFCQGSTLPLHLQGKVSGRQKAPLLSIWYEKCHINKWSTPTEKSEEKGVLVHYLASTWPSLHSNTYSWISRNNWVIGRIRKVSATINESAWN